MNFFSLSTPHDMLAKAMRELARLKNDVNIDNVYNFYITVYHIKDYAEKNFTCPNQRLEEFLKHEDLVYAGDLCNKGKHLKLTRKRQDFGTMINDNALSGNSWLGIMKLSGGDEWLLIDGDNRFVDILELAERVVMQWTKFLNDCEKDNDKK